MRDLVRSAREKQKKISDREYSLLDLDAYREELAWLFLSKKEAEKLQSGIIP